MLCTKCGSDNIDWMYSDDLEKLCLCLDCDYEWTEGRVLLVQRLGGNQWLNNGRMTCLN